MKMKELLQVWSRVAGKTYSAVGRSEGESSLQNADQPSPRKIAKRKHRKRLIALFSLSITSLAVGLFILLANPYDFFFRLKVIFSPGGEIFEMWRKPEIDLYIKIYLFNVTNSEAFLAGREKIKVEQVGPYIYKEILEHSNVTFNDNNTLSSIPLHPLEWQPELSAPFTEDDVLILPNIAMLSISHVASERGYLARLALSGLLRTTGAKPLESMTAKAFMFGHTSTLVTLGNSFLPGWIKFDKLGLIDRMYDFESDFETVFTGADDASKAGLMDTWRGERNLPHWKSETTDHCSNVHMASDGTKFKGGIQKNDTLLFYRKSLCRAAEMVYDDEASVGGLHAYKYVFEKDSLDNGYKDSRNKCYCRQGKCLPAGLIDVTDCYYGFPIALSYPHFLNTNESLIEKVEGLSPDPKLHGSEMWIQPDSGLPLDVTARFQINMALSSNLKSVRDAAVFSGLVLPLLWFEIRLYSLPEHLSNRFKLYLNILPKMESAIMWIEFIAAPLLLLAAFYFLFRGYCTNRHSKSHSIPNNYVRSLRKLSMDIEAKIQGVYAPCEIPLTEGSDSASPFLDTSDQNGSDTSDGEHDQVEQPPVTDERRPSLIKIHADKIMELGVSLGNKLQENIEGISKNIKSLTNKLNDTRSSSESNEDANHNEGFNTESCTSSNEECDGIVGEYSRVNASDDEDCCHLEVVDDGSQFDGPRDETARRKSLDLARRMSLMEGWDPLSRLAELPEEQV